MYLQTVIFTAPKDGNAPSEWEDAAGWSGAARSGPPAAAPDRARFAVADGASEGFDSRGWVSELVASFLAADRDGGRPLLGRRAMRDWCERRQDAWAAASPLSTDDIVRRKQTEEGSYATFLGCELTGLDGPVPRWRAVALGDTVLFHVRADALRAKVPDLGPRDFGLHPDVVHSFPSQLDAMAARMIFADGSLLPGDMLLAATDALAHWIVKADAGQEKLLWPFLAAVSHPAAFARFVRDQRRSSEMHNDDVTLLRIRVLREPPNSLVVSL
jgi:hypothetical protein